MMHKKQEISTVGTVEIVLRGGHPPFDKSVKWYKSQPDFRLSYVVWLDGGRHPSIV